MDIFTAQHINGIIIGYDIKAIYTAILSSLVYFVIVLFIGINNRSGGVEHVIQINTLFFFIFILNG